jgi:hypothetical protein
MRGYSKIILRTLSVALTYIRLPASLQQPPPTVFFNTPNSITHNSNDRLLQNIKLRTAPFPGTSEKYFAKTDKNNFVREQQSKQIPLTQVCKEHLKQHHHDILDKMCLPDTKNHSIKITTPHLRHYRNTEETHIGLRLNEIIKFQLCN